MIYALLALVSAIVAAVSFYFFQTNKESGTLLLVVGAISVLLTVIFGIVFMSGRINKTEDIHITE
jgi:uncharacterized membrane protein